jgi:hypothetical protein
VFDNECGSDAVVDCAGECGGSVTEDCAGECNGSEVYDDCGECGGSNSSGCVTPGEICDSGYPANTTICGDLVCQYDCNGSCLSAWGLIVPMTGDGDCTGECGGSTFFDCTGVCGGNASKDDCSVCNGNNLDALPPQTQVQSKNVEPPHSPVQSPSPVIGTIKPHAERHEPLQSY